MPLTTKTTDTLLRLKPTKRIPDAVTVTGLLGASPATVYRWVREGAFPAPILIGPRAARWRLSDVQAWLAARPAATISRGEAA